MSNANTSSGPRQRAMSPAAAGMSVAFGSFSLKSPAEDLFGDGDVDMEVPGPSDRALPSRAVVAYAATSVNEILDLIPAEYRTALRKDVLRLAENARKSVDLRAQVRKLRAHTEAGTFPSWLQGNKKPALQLSAEFAALHAAELDVFDEEHRGFKVRALKQGLELKEAELHAISAALLPTAYMPRFIERCNTVRTEMSAMAHVPRWEKDAAGLLRVKEGDWALSQAFVIAYESLLKDLPDLLARVCIICTAREDSSASALERKKELKKAAEAKMQTDEPKSVAALVKNEVKRLLGAQQGRGKGKGKQPQGGKPKGSPRTPKGKKRAAKNAAIANAKGKGGPAKKKGPNATPKKSSAPKSKPSGGKPRRRPTMTRSRISYVCRIVAGTNLGGLPLKSRTSLLASNALRLDSQNGTAVSISPLKGKPHLEEGVEDILHTQEDIDSLNDSLLSETPGVTLKVA
ncbi:hypothetical protein BS17DRAFT_848888 [Gyrodon lividus]|nr:hypothetical protein BS17DRAFT_848888 [Gyrodon lividus]